MKRKKTVVDAAPKPKKYKKKIENPEKKRARYVYEIKGDSGKIWEKNRRDRLNKAFDDLAILLPVTDNQPVSKLSKIEILSRSCTHIQSLSERLNKVEMELNIILNDKNTNESNDVVSKSRVEVACNTDQENIISKKFNNQYVQCRLLTCKKKKVKIDCEIQTNLLDADRLAIFGQTVDPLLTKLVSQEVSSENSSPSINSLISSSVRVTPALISTPIMTPGLYLPNYTNIVIQAPPLIAQPSFYIINNNTQTTTNITSSADTSIQKKSENGHTPTVSLKQRVKLRKKLKRFKRCEFKKMDLKNSNNPKTLDAQTEQIDEPTLTSTPIKDCQKPDQKLKRTETSEKNIVDNTNHKIKDLHPSTSKQSNANKTTQSTSAIEATNNLESKNKVQQQQKVSTKQTETVKKITSNINVAKTIKPLPEVANRNKKSKLVKPAMNENKSKSHKAKAATVKDCKVIKLEKPVEGSTARAIQFIGDSKPDDYISQKLQSSIQEVRNKQQRTPPLSSADIPLTLPDNEIETEIIQALTVPHRSVAHNQSSVSPITKAYLVSFPVLSSGKQMETQEQQETDTDKVNLNDSSVRTMIDLENLFPSNLLKNIDTTNEQEAAAIKEKISDTRMSSIENHLPRSIPSTSTASITVAPSSFLHDFGTTAFPTKKPLPTTTRHIDSTSYCSSFVHPNTLRQPTLQNGSMNSTQFSSAAQFSNQHNIFPTPTLDYRVTDKSTADQYSLNEMPSNFTFSLTSSTSTDSKYTFNSSTNQTKSNQVPLQLNYGSTLKYDEIVNTVPMKGFTQPNLISSKETLPAKVSFYNTPDNISAVPYYNSTSSSFKSLSMHTSKKPNSNVIPETNSRNMYHIESASKERYPLFNDLCNNRSGPLAQSGPSAAASGSCAKAYNSNNTQKNNFNKKSCTSQQNQSSTKYDISWMTSSEFKSTTPDFTLLAPYEYYTQPSNMTINNHYTSTASFPSFDGSSNKKSDLYFAHPPNDENNLPWSPSKMTNLLDSNQITGNQYMSSPLPNLHGDLALNTGAEIKSPHAPKTLSVKKGHSDTTNNSFLSVHQLMGTVGSETTQNQSNANNNSNNNHDSKIRNGETMVKTVRTKAEKKSMPPAFPCDLNPFETQRTYNYSTEAILSSNTSSAANRSKSKITAPVTDSYVPNVHLSDSYTTATFPDTDQFYPATKCDLKLMNQSYVENSLTNLQHNIYQPPSFNRNQIPSSASTSFNFTPNFAPYQTENIHEKKYPHSSQSTNNGTNLNDGTNNSEQLYNFSNCNLQQKIVPRVGQPSTVKSKNRQQHTYFQEFPMFSQTDTNLPFNQSYVNYVNFNLNQQGVDTNINFGATSSINHQNTHNSSGTSNLTNFNLSTICPEI